MSSSSNPPKSTKQSQSHDSQPAAEEEAPTIYTGKVKWFNPVRGFGFITPSDGSPDIFVHQTCIYAQGFRSLQAGEQVEYYVEEGEDGRLRATSVSGPNGAYVDSSTSPPPQDGGYVYNANVGYYNNRGGYGYTPGSRGRGFGRGYGSAGGGRCFNCNRPGHFARDCPVGRTGCFSCGKQGHFARDCPQGY